MTKMTREELHDSFYRLFAAPGEGPVLSIDELIRTEADLSVVFPEAYVAFATKYGAIFTPSILTLVTGGESEMAPEGASWDVQQFFTAEEIVKDSRLYWSGGMDSELVGIASDCMGNIFGFRRRQGDIRPDDSSLFFFDHDFCKVREESRSFDAWIESFIRLSER